MNSKKIIFILFCILLHTTSMIFAQDTLQWSLEQCIQYALENNLQIKRQSLVSQNGITDLKSANSNRLPNLTGNYGYQFNFGRSIDQSTNQFVTTKTQNSNVSLRSNVNIFNGFKNQNTIQKNRLGLAYNKYQLEAVQNDITIAVLNAFLNILVQKDNLDNLKNQYKVSKKQLYQTKRFVTIGTKAKKELLQIQSQMAKEQSNIITAQNNIDLAYLDLTQLLNLSPEQNFSIIIPENIDVNLSLIDSATTLNKLVTDALPNRPKVQGANIAIEMSKKNIAIERSNKIPTLSANWSLSSFYSSRGKKKSGAFVTNQQSIGYLVSNPSEFVATDVTSPLYVNEKYFSQLNSNMGQAAGIGLSIPIFNRFQTKFRIDKAKVSYLDSKYQAEQTKNSITKDMLTALTNLKAAEKKYMSTEAELKLTKELFDISEKQYEQNIISFIEYVDAKNQLANAKINLLQAKYQLIFNKKIVGFYKGEAISLN